MRNDKWTILPNTGMILLLLFTFSNLTNSGENMKLSSTVITDGNLIPKIYTCQGEDVSPPLSWNDAPDGTRSFALIVDDPDAPIGEWVHWVLFNIPPQSAFLPESVPADSALPSRAVQGINDFGNIGYGGPCPPGGKPHRYFFKLYALDITLKLKPGATKKQVIQAMEKHILAEAKLMGMYKK